MTNRLSFEICDWFGVAIIPQIDGQPLSALATEFEQAAGLEPSGGYGGLLPSSFRYGSLDHCFMGDPDHPSYWTELGEFYVLGCKGCGTVGCWPLICSISANKDSVMWKNFNHIVRDGITRALVLSRLIGLRTRDA